MMPNEQGNATLTKGANARAAASAPEPAPSAAAGADNDRWPKGLELAERVAVAVKLGKLPMRDHFSILTCLITDQKNAERTLRMLAADGIDLRGEEFTFAGAAKKAAAKEG